MILKAKKISIRTLSSFLIYFFLLASSAASEDKQSVYVHVAANLELINQKKLRLSLDKFDNSRFATLGKNFQFLSTNKWESIWIANPTKVISGRGKNATIAWLDSNELKYDELLILAAKISEDRKYVDYEIQTPTKNEFQDIGFAAILFDPKRSGICAFSVLEDAEVDGLNEALLAGAGVASLDCLLDEYISIILNPAINRRVSPFYGFILNAVASD